MKNTLSQNIISFFKECYESDNRETFINNLFSRKVENLLSVDKSKSKEFFKNKTASFDQENLSRIAGILSVNKREKKLVFSNYHLVVNIRNNEGKIIKCNAPIAIYDAEVIKNDFKNDIIVEISEPNWNLPVIRDIIDDSNQISSIESLIDNTNLYDINLNEFFKWININCLNFDFKLELEKDLDFLNKISKSRAINKAYIIECGTLFIVNRSPNTRGILHEIELLCDTVDFSNSLEQLLLGNQSKVRNIKKPDFNSLPGILSDAQKTILEKASSKVLTQVIGPPGTGKSYTIANIAIDCFLKGESVLVVSQNEHAINVIHKHLSTKLGVSSKGVVRAGSSLYHNNLKNYVADLLNNKKQSITLKKTGNSSSYKIIDLKGESKKELEKVKREISNLEKKYVYETNKAVGLGLKLDSYFKQKSIAKLLAELRLWINDRNYNNPKPLFKLLDDLQILYGKREKLVAQLINTKYENYLNKLLNDTLGRRTILRFQTILKSRNSSRQASFFKLTNYKTILKVFPIWLSSLEGLHRSLPLEKELFDLVIIDEATQCDITSCLPAIQRAKRLVVVGDPKQLRHISFLSINKQNAIRTKYNLNGFDINLNYRDDSIIDMINYNLASSNDVVLLNEHFRGLPKLIEFSNKKFYGNRLRIMTDKPVLNNQNPISIIKTKGEHQKGTNEQEADTLINYLKEIINNQRELPLEYKLSIGVLSFFRNQSELLQSKILQISADDIANHNLRAGTPYAFQGEERDIILISCCLDDNSHPSSYQYLNRENMFNVAITRAKSSQILFLSADIKNMPTNNLLSEYLQSAKQFIDQSENLELLKCDDIYINQLSDLLKKKNIKLVQNYSIAATAMDLIAIYKNNSIAIDLIGFPGKYEDAFPLKKYNIFHRAGFRIFPITLNEWKYKQEKIIDRLTKELKNKIEEEEIQVTLQSLSDKWPLLLKYNPVMAKEVRLLEIDLFELKNNKIIDQLGELVESYHKFIKTLEIKLERGEHTFNRYKVAADSVLQLSINTYKKIIALSQSIPNLSQEDANHPILHLVKEQKLLINNQLEKNKMVITSIQKMTINWSNINTKTESIDSELLFDELNSLNNQIKHYETN